MDPWSEITLEEFSVHARNSETPPARRPWSGKKEAMVPTRAAPGLAERSCPKCGTQRLCFVDSERLPAIRPAAAVPDL